MKERLSEDDNLLKQITKNGENKDISKGIKDRGISFAFKERRN